MSEYNGWTNRITWHVNLALMNDENTYYDDVFGLNDEGTTIQEMASAIRDYVYGILDESTDLPLARHVLGEGLALVNWQEIAEGFMDEHNNVNL